MEYLPATHAVQAVTDVLPVVVPVVCVPRGQNKQTLAPVAGEYVPVKQFVQASNPWLDANLPAKQATHESALVFPPPSLYFPNGHNEHSPDPNELYVPALH